MSTRHAGALVDDVLAEAAQARHGADEADLRERLLDGILGDAQRVGDGQTAHVVLHQRGQQLRHLAAQAFAVTRGRGKLRRVRGGTPRATHQQQSDDRPVLHVFPPKCARSCAGRRPSVRPFGDVPARTDQSVRPESVTYVSGMNCYPHPSTRSIRVAKGRFRRVTSQFTAQFLDTARWYNSYRLSAHA
jgi:hypothetical protein